MPGLLREIGELLKKQPTLLLPYLIADLLAVCLWRLRGTAEVTIVHWFTTGHSVFGGDVAFSRSGDKTAALFRAFICYLPVAVGSIVAVTWFFVAALMATAAMVQLIEQQEEIDGRRVATELVRRSEVALWFTLRFLITWAVCAILVIGPTLYFLYATYRMNLGRSLWYETGGVLVIAACGGWLVMPAVFRLLAIDRAVLGHSPLRIQGTILVILAAEAQVAIGYLLPKLENWVVLDSRWGIFALSVCNSVLANAPDAVLFVALGLLVAKPFGEGSYNNNSRRREILPILMPMHFTERNEPPKSDM